MRLKINTPTYLDPVLPATATNSVNAQEKAPEKSETSASGNVIDWTVAYRFTRA